ncbi:hypothetical protein OG730_00890 [Streptomyces sp. NBC_01298]|uniref:hypothetical protein n=1 Tax=Streptomyces sp. NBC_01298 TaxID=2903817 RepID=UPI002E0E8ED1|nr:hypothetical protein OG730_00890 [Streptomyces sp. NBC_01298]
MLRERGVGLFVQVLPGDSPAHLAAAAFPDSRVAYLQANSLEHISELVAAAAVGLSFPPPGAAKTGRTPAVGPRYSHSWLKLGE